MGTSAYPPPFYPGMPTTMPMPPRLHWGWVLALTLLTRNLFGVIWLVVQAVWVRKATGHAGPLRWAIAHLCAFPLLFAAGLVVGVGSAHSGMSADSFRTVVLGLEMVSGLAILVLYLTTIFTLRAALEAPPIGIPLGSVMTFFFGPIYFQYFLRDWMPLGYSAPPLYAYPNVPPV